MSRLVLLSTYELGARPLGCTVPAALLEAAGHEVRAVDLSIEPWPAGEVAAADGVVLSVPMHTALRLGNAVVDRLRGERPGVPLFVHGLYAHAAAAAAGRGFRPGDVAVAGEAGDRLVAWASDLAPPERPPAALVTEIGSARPGPRPAQARAGLPDLASYARLRVGEDERLVGTLATTSGCNHRCRHCPVPVVYGGRSRPEHLDTALAEAGALVAEGAVHLHLADPDFLNRPAHAVAFARALHAAHPGVTFDATIKVSHLLRHARLLPDLAAAGLAFVISALESTSDVVLGRLDKGHDRAGGREAVRLLRRAGIEPRPSFLPFTPWTARDDVIDLLDFVAEEDLVWNVDAVQYGIRLLLPPGSLLLEDPDEVLAASLTGDDPAAGGTAWRSADPALDACQADVAALAEALEDAETGAEEAYAAIRAAVFAALGEPDPGAPASTGVPGPPGPLRPRLTESWFCCAEPTRTQLAGVGEPAWGAPAAEAVAVRSPAARPGGSGLTGAQPPGRRPPSARPG